MISVVGQASAAGTSVVIPAHLPGDLIVLSARGTALAPVKPAAGGTVPTWLTCQSAILNAIGLTTVAANVTRSDLTSGVFANATHVAVVVLRSDVGNLVLGPSSTANTNNTATCIYPALALSSRAGSSLGVRSAVRVTATAAFGTTLPPGWVNQVKQPAVPFLVMHTRAGLTADPTADTVSALGANAGTRAHTVEVTEVPKTIIGEAAAMRLGSVPVKAVHAGTEKAWGLDPATQAYVDASGLPTAYVAALDGLVLGLKAKGLWAKMRAVYPFVGGTAALHRWNLMDPRDLDAAYRLTYAAGDPSQHTLALGYRPNEQGQQKSSPRFANTHLVPLGTLGQDSTHLAFYSTQDVPPADRAEMGCYGWAGTGSRFHIIASYEPGDFYYGMSEDGFTHVSSPVSSGLFVATRPGSTAQVAYRNGAQLATSAAPSIPLPPTPVYIGAINEFANRSDIPCGFASIGDGLSAANVADLYAVVQAYQNALGRAV